MSPEVERLKELIDNSDNIVFFGGAGVSTESNIPDFRSENGIYNAVNKYGYPPETMLSHSFFVSHPEIFFEYLRTTLIYPEAKPNYAHIGLAELEKQGKLKAVITQNIDNLHQMAGSVNVYELPGTLYKNYCVKCHKKFDINYIMESKGIPHCDECGGIVRPDVVLYEEGLNSKTIYDSVSAIENADVLIVGGTSLNVYPAAGFIDYYRKNKLVLINKSETSYDRRANLIIRENIGEVFKEVLNL